MNVEIERKFSDLKNGLCALHSYPSPALDLAQVDLNKGSAQRFNRGKLGVFNYLAHVNFNKGSAQLFSRGKL